MSTETLAQGKKFLGMLRNTDLNFRKLGAEHRSGGIFTFLPKELMDLTPGSYISPDMFFSEMGIDSSRETKKMLLGDRIGHYDSPIIPRMRFEGKDGGSFSFSITHGATNEYIMSASRLATKGAKDDNNRSHYQDEVLHIMMPLLQNHEDQEAVGIELNEDCGATGITEALFIKMSSETKLASKKIRINVAVATAQSVLVVKKLALDNDLDIELNVGSMAFGLSRGKRNEQGVIEHANYIVYPRQLIHELNELFGNGFDDFYEEIFSQELGEAFVVGDMGDLSLKLPDDKNVKHKYNSYRVDDYIPEDANKGDYRFESAATQPEYIEGQHTEVYLPNGGLLIRALKRYLNPGDHPSEEFIDAKRKEVNGRYGVLFYNIPQEILN